MIYYFYFQVDGQDLTGFTHREAVAYLRQTSDVVTLRFYKPTAEERAVAEAKANITKVSQQQQQNCCLINHQHHLHHHHHAWHHQCCCGIESLSLILKS